MEGKAKQTIISSRNIRKTLADAYGFLLDSTAVDFKIVLSLKSTVSRRTQT